MGVIALDNPFLGARRQGQSLGDPGHGLLRHNILGLGLCHHGQDARISDALVIFGASGAMGAAVEFVMTTESVHTRAASPLFVFHHAAGLGASTDGRAVGTDIAAIIGFNRCGQILLGPWDSDLSLQTLAS
jgi:hypothetical protein